ncbi:molybdopterin molybdotransferase MoeA [Halobaculum sp. CBA1158]|uniref:molybdopterin molybdotransferase MoeA n=1 Tax=Halobaculum sp. CBA1158 TaxID=2904243 RepID=UPI001F3BC241|nr:molybdopterin molybdotransferase MoeA [Halobaculum sp. CBA1158]UIP00451.1 molybdopterin molybdotransferase MoeA [Halobaculum sp. CBA1158]
MDEIEREAAVDRLRTRFDAGPTAIEATDTGGSASETVGPEAIGGRVLTEAVVAPSTVPARPFATMDGFALAAGDDAPRRIAGRVDPADDPGALADGTAVRIATGAPLPEGADAVVPVEHATVEGDRLVGAAPVPEPGAHLFPAGASATEGEVLFEPGRRLAPRHAALLCDLGIDRLAVAPRRSAAVLATGTEIVRGDQPDRDSAMLANLLRGWGCVPTVLDPVPDERERVASAIEAAAADHDLVVTAGGTSVGAGDHVGDALADHDPLFAGVALRPGRPTTAAVVDGTPVCAFPGKPLAAHTAATLVLGPALVDSADAATVTATATSRVAFPSDSVEYAVPVALDDGDVTPVGQGDGPEALYGERFRPGRVASATRATLADGLLVTDDDVAAGDRVAVTPYGVIE